MSDTVLFNEKAPWTDDDMQTLAKLYFSVSDPKKRPFDAMVAALGRSKAAIQSEISRRGMAARGAQLRICLGAECYGRRKFFSAAAGHRICPSCAELNPKFIGV